MYFDPWGRLLYAFGDGRWDISRHGVYPEHIVLEHRAKGITRSSIAFSERKVFHEEDSCKHTLRRRWRGARISAALDNLGLVTSSRGIPNGAADRPPSERIGPVRVNQAADVQSSLLRK
jgi:hypothetical protein